MTPREHGRYSTHWTDLELLQGVRAVLQAQATPGRLAQRRFDAERGRVVPELPAARVIVTRLGRPWPNIVEVAEDPERSLERTIQAWTRDEPALHSEEAIGRALRAIARRLGQTWLAPHAYDVELDRLKDSEARHYRRGIDVSVDFPSLNQIQNRMTWDEALRLAGLDRRPPRPPDVAALTDVLTDFIEQFDLMPSYNALCKYAQRRGIRMQTRKTAKWAEVVNAVSQTRREMGASVPDEPCGAADVEGFDIPPDPGQHPPRRTPQRPHDLAACRAALIAATQALSDGQVLTQRRYMALRQSDWPRYAEIVELAGEAGTTFSRLRAEARSALRDMLDRSN